MYIEKESKLEVISKKEGELVEIKLELADVRLFSFELPWGLESKQKKFELGDIRSLKRNAFEKIDSAAQKAIKEKYPDSTKIIPGYSNQIELSFSGSDNGSNFYGVTCIYSILLKSGEKAKSQRNEEVGFGD